MTNPYQSGGPYSPSPHPMFRRSSYASVAAGTASAAPPSFSPPTRSGAFSHLTNTHHSSTRRPSRSGMDLDDRPGSWGKGSIHVGSWGSAHDGFLGGDGPQEPRFFVPSYLRHSRYVQRLEEEHKARVQAARDARHSHMHTPYPASGPGSLSTSSSSVNLHKMSSRAGPVQDVIERLPPAGVDEELRPLPSRWSESDKCSGLEVLLDGTEVRFQGVIKTSDEAAAVRSDHPMPRECGIYYFEVTILSKGKDPT